MVLNKMDEFSFGFVLLQQDYYRLGLIQKIVDKDMSSLQLSAWEEDGLLLQLFWQFGCRIISIKLQNALGKWSLISILSKLGMLRDLLAGYWQLVICAIELPGKHCPTLQRAYLFAAGTGKLCRRFQ